MTNYPRESPSVSGNSFLGSTGHWATAIESAYGKGVNVLPRPARNERGEGWGEGKSNKNAPPLPVPLLPQREERGKLTVFPLCRCLLQGHWSSAVESRTVAASNSNAMRQLRRSGLFVANASHPAKSPVGAAPSASMPLLRSFVFYRSLSTKMPPRWGWERRRIAWLSSASSRRLCDWPRAPLVWA